ncbi:serine/threonine-protein kinase [Actinoplanes utahensis]|uniref:non-specific serine/threonine protein kinase n=1 Tax=Actinoplanes utahensis TaxID=1869 RepID=A0A0A6XGI1_ACTUT|nr:serine/threonine-protein kinase [Actinoplanes utahensis]KHD79202.1 hypothetical protein MB27_00835 [Actinoplanes utahensis]GIF30390.1 hypothetical protein Aut01nite_33760 [Actinoplanes utahensis]
MAAVGEVVAGRYRLVRPLASGSMSRIWLAADETVSRAGTTYGPGGPGPREARPHLVVLKHCAVPRGLPPDQHQAIRRWALPEARAAAAVRHPHVIHTLDVMPSWDGPWLVMEYLPSRTLHQVISESGPLTPARAAAIGLAVLSGLDAAADMGVLHLDVKPGNVLIAADGRAVLTDFGPVVTPAGVKALADSGIVLGSPKYIAPERIHDRASDRRSDLWSLGATLYHAVEGHPPFQRASTTELLSALADPHPAPPRRAGPLTPVLTGLLRRDPADRLTAAEVERLLRGIVDAGRRRPRTARRRRIPVIAAAIAVAATLTAVAATAEGRTRSGSGAAPAVSAPAATPASRPPTAPAGTPTSRPPTAPAGTPTSRPPTAPAAAPGSRPSTASPPDGYTWWSDPGGYRVAVPSGWRRGEPAAGGLTFTGKRGRAALGITPLAEPPSDLFATLTAAEEAADLDSYKRVRIQILPEPSSAVWEYTFSDTDGTAMHALQRVTRAGGRAYVLEWRATRAAWTSELSRFTVVLASFGPRA